MYFSLLTLSVALRSLPDRARPTGNVFAKAWKGSAFSISVSGVEQVGANCVPKRFAPCDARVTQHSLKTTDATLAVRQLVCTAWMPSDSGGTTGSLHASDSLDMDMAKFKYRTFIQLRHNCIQKQLRAKVFSTEKTDFTIEEGFY